MFTRQTVQKELSLNAIAGKLKRQLSSTSELADQLDREKSDKADAQAAAAAVRANLRHDLSIRGEFHRAVISPRLYATAGTHPRSQIN